MVGICPDLISAGTKMGKGRQTMKFSGPRLQIRAERFDHQELLDFFPRHINAAEVLWQTSNRGKHRKASKNDLFLLLQFGGARQLIVNIIVRISTSRNFQFNRI